MTLFNSQRYRLTATIFTLVSIVALLLLWGLMATAHSGHRQRIKAREEVFVDLIASKCHHALLTGEYDEVQIFAGDLLRSPHIEKIVLADRRGRIVVSTTFAEIGEPFIPDKFTAPQWRHLTITNPAGPLGTLAVLFSHGELTAVTQDMQRVALILLLPILLTVAGVSWALASVVVRRLESLTAAAQQVAAGNFDTRVAESGSDEIGLLARTFNTMADSLQHSFSALSTSEARLITAQQAAHIGSWELNLTTNALWWSEEAYRIFELLPEQFGASYESFLARVHPEDRGRIHKTHAASVQDKTPYDIVHRILMADGRVKFVQELGRNYYSPDNTPLRSVGTVQDVTERILAEEELRIKDTAMNSAISAIALCRLDNTLSYVNQAWLKIHGYDDPAEVLGTSPHQHVQNPEEAAEVIDDIIATGQWKGELMCRRRNGSVFPAEFACNLVTNSAGQPIGTMASLQDISDRRRAEAERLEMERRLQQAQKMEAIGTLAGGIAHDFNNILSAIFGYTELAIETKEKDPTKQTLYLERVRLAAERAKDLVAQILTFSRRTELKKQPLQVAAVIKEALKLLRASIPTTIAITADIGSLGTVLADPVQIHQVVMNLCTNAYHAMRERGGTMTVILEEVDIFDKDVGQGELTPGRYLKLVVSDTGDGISPEVLGKIFEPYFTTKQTGEGTGLGLAVVHNIVTSLNGYIVVDSKPGKVTAFSIYLPLLIGEKVSEPPKKEGPADLSGRGERILLVDDEALIREFVEALLSQHGYQVTPRMNGVDALETFQEHPDQFDLVITDMTMPFMTGAMLAQRIIGIRPDIPIILCSGGQREEITREKALQMGIRDYLNKPVSNRDLLFAIRKGLEG